MYIEKSALIVSLDSYLGNANLQRIMGKMQI